MTFGVKNWEKNAHKFCTNYAHVAHGLFHQLKTEQDCDIFTHFAFDIVRSIKLINVLSVFLVPTIESRYDNQN